LKLRQDKKYCPPLTSGNWDKIIIAVCVIDGTSYEVSGHKKTKGSFILYIETTIAFTQIAIENTGQI
jgi:hypothetical protein